MEPDLQLVIKGLPQELGEAAGSAIAATVRAFESEWNLDLRRMHRIVVAAEYGAELAELSASTASGNPIAYTNEEYALGVAKVLTLPGRLEPEILPVIDARIAAALVAADFTEVEDVNDVSQMVLHLLHHEFCHVHDRNKYIDAFSDLMFVASYEGKDRFTRPLAEGCWDEYSANRRSARTAPNDSLLAVGETFAGALERTKGLVDSEVLEYRSHADLDRLIEAFGRHGEFLPRTASYVLGFMDGLDISLEELSPEAAARLPGSYFESTFRAMHHEFQSLEAAYAVGWSGFDVFDPLAAVIDDYYSCMGLDLESMDDGSVYISVPFRPETTPDL